MASCTTLLPHCILSFSFSFLFIPALNSSLRFLALCRCTVRRLNLIYKLYTNKICSSLIYKYLSVNKYSFFLIILFWLMFTKIFSLIILLILLNFFIIYKIVLYLYIFTLCICKQLSQTFIIFITC